MKIERILTLFGIFTGLATDQLTTWQGLCENAKSLLETRLREEYRAATQHEERLCTVAAAYAYAYADYLLLGGSSSRGEQVKVGDISIGNSDTTAKEDSQSIRDYFTAQIEDLLCTPDFLFTAMGGDESGH